MRKTSRATVPLLIVLVGLIGAIVQLELRQPNVPALGTENDFLTLSTAFRTINQTNSGRTAIVITDHKTSIAKEIDRLTLQSDLFTTLQIRSWYFNNRFENFKFSTVTRAMSTQLAVRSRVQRERQKIGIVSQIAEAASAASGERDPIIEKAIDRLLVFQQEIAPDSAAGHVKIPLANRDIAAVLDRILSNAANVPSAADAAFTIKIDPRSPLAPVLRSYLNEPPELNFVRTPNRIEIQKNLMTQIQWFEINGTGPSFFNRVTDCPETHRIIAGVALCPDHPVESVSVEEVNATIKKINQLSSVHRYRLPTADEWEVSARAGRKTPFTFGRSIANASDHAWYLQNADLQTHPVGTKRPNDWGLYDMTGHLWQLVDAPLNFQTTFNPAQRSHQLQPAVESVVVRGGSWIDGPELLDVSQSSRLPHDWTCYDVGLRLVRTGR